MNQKLISILLLFSCFSIGDTVLYAKNEFLPYAEILSSIGIIRNYKTEEEYRLFTSLSRGEAIQLVVNIENGEKKDLPICNKKDTSGYRDVGKNLGTICGSIYEAIDLGILEVGNGTRFYPKKPITRGEFARLLGKLLPDESGEISSGGKFLDMNNQNLETKEGIGKLVNHGCVNIYSQYFFPERYILKGEAYKLAGCFIHF